MHAAGHQLASLEDGRHGHEHVVACGIHIVGHGVLEGQHALDVQIARAGDEVSLVGVLARELVAQKMAAIEQVLALHEIVLGHLPSGGAHLADGTALLRGLGLGAHDGEGGGAAA